MEMRPASAADFLAFEYEPLSVRATTGRGVAETAETVPATLAVPSPGCTASRSTSRGTAPAVDGVRVDAAVERQHRVDELDAQRRAAGRARRNVVRRQAERDLRRAERLLRAGVRSKNAASSSALPAAVSLKTQYAVWVVVPVHDSASCASGTGTPLTSAVPVGARTSISPGTGTIAPPRSPARTRASDGADDRARGPPFDGEAASRSRAGRSCRRSAPRPCGSSPGRTHRARSAPRRPAWA